MPVLKLYPNGLTGGVPPRLVNHNPISRGDCEGWTLKSSRSNTRFLYSIRSPELPTAADGTLLLGLALSFTLLDCPPSHEDWRNVREAFFDRLRRRGLYRLHWLTEWQKRGVPHLHAALWFDVSAVRAYMLKNWPTLPVAAFEVLLKADWLMLTARYRSSNGAQDIKPISDDLGWLKYLSKHAARGAAHYQRAIGSMPAGWQKTGRMWGHLGDFPTSEPLGLDLDDAGWFQFRRIVRRWRISQARSERQPSARRIRSARRMLCCSDRALSWVRGVSEWISLDLGLSIVHWLSSVGYSVDSIL
jgi:hypothetical protein